MPDEVPSAYLVAFCTCPPDKAADIARELVARKTCACVNIVPGLRSFYVWKGEVEDDAESLLVIKTRADRFDDLERAVRELHPYEVFELIALPVDRGNAAYLRWIDESLWVDRSAKSSGQDGL